MPRQSRSRPAARPAAKPAAAAPAQSRGAHTAAATPTSANAHPPAPAAAPSSKGPGLFGQMAANAASFAAGSVIGHGVSNMLFGKNGEAIPAPQELQAQQQMPVQDDGRQMCSARADDFLTCAKNAADPTNDCKYFLDALNACQQAAARY